MGTRASCARGCRGRLVQDLRGRQADGRLCRHRASTRASPRSRARDRPRSAVALAPAWRACAVEAVGRGPWQPSRAAGPLGVLGRNGFYCDEKWLETWYRAFAPARARTRSARTPPVTRFAAVPARLAWLLAHVLSAPSARRAVRARACAVRTLYVCRTRAHVCRTRAVRAHGTRYARARVPYARRTRARAA